MDAATLGAVGTIVVGLAAATAAYIGQRSSARAAQTGVLITGYGGLVDQVQEERDKLSRELAEKERELAAAYTALAGERAEKAGLQAQIAELTAQRERLLAQIAALGGPQ